MYIIADDVRFTPQNFVVCEFYNEIICLCWGKNKLVVFPYTKENSTSTIRTLTAPADINKIYCYSSRIFIVCIPCGIYKLNREKEFAILSKSAIGIGAYFYEVLTPKDEFLHLDNKQSKCSKPLFKLFSESKCSSELCIFPINSENATENFRKALMGKDYDKNICIIGNGKKLYRLANETANIIYSCESVIVDILPITDSEGITGLIFITGQKTITLMCLKDSQLYFEKVHINSEICTLCAGLSRQHRDILWIVHSDEVNLYYCRKVIGSDGVQQTKIEERSFVSLQFYDKEFILGLTPSKRLISLPIEDIENAASCDNNKFIPLHGDMLKDTDIIINKIKDKAKELEILNKVLQDEENKLKRINLYSYEKRIHACPKIFPLFNISNKLLLKIEFQDCLPKKTQIIVSVTGNSQRTYCIKTVESVETVVEIPVPESIISSSTKLVIDLAAFIGKGTFWCLIKNFIIDPVIDKKRKGRSKKDKKSFISSKMEMITDLLRHGNLDIGKLNEIKRSVRKEIT